MLAGMQNLPVFVLVAALVACHTPCPPASTDSAPSMAAPCPVADAAAPKPPPPPPPTPHPAADASAEPHDACWNAAQKLLALSCKDTRGRLIGGPDLSGVSWSTTCRQNLTNGVNLNAACITAAASCVVAEACK